MRNFDSAYSTFEATWRYGPPEDPVQDAIDEEIDELCTDEEFLERFEEEHPGIDIESEEALPILQRRRGPLRRLRLRSFPSFAARWSITEPIWLYSAIAGKRWSAPQGTASMDIPSSAYIKTARSWKKTESARP